MNERLLKAKMVERGISVDDLAKALGLHPMTVRMKIKDDGFKVTEARAIEKALLLTSEEVRNIFFAQ